MPPPFFRFRSRSRLVGRADCSCAMEGTEAVFPLLLSLAALSSRMIWPLFGGWAANPVRLGTEPAIVFPAADDTDLEMGRVLALARSSRRCRVSEGNCLDLPTPPPFPPLRMLETEVARRPSTTVTLESFLALPLVPEEDAFPFPLPPFVLTSKWTTLNPREHAL